MPACPRADQGGKNALRSSLSAAEQIAYLQVGQGGDAVRPHILFQHAGHADVIDVVACELRERPVLAVAGNRAHHQPWIAFLQRLPADAELVHHSGTEAFNDNVGCLDHLQKVVALRRILQVEPEALLAAIDCDEELRHFLAHRTHGARIVASARILDLDHFGAHVGKMHGGYRARQQPGEVEDANTVQRFVDRLIHACPSGGLALLVISVFPAHPAVRAIRFRAVPVP